MVCGNCDSPGSVLTIQRGRASFFVKGPEGPGWAQEFWGARCACTLEIDWRAGHEHRQDRADFQALQILKTSQS
jgi:hypothetical protein